MPLPVERNCNRGWRTFLDRGVVLRQRRGLKLKERVEASSACGRHSLVGCPERVEASSACGRHSLVGCPGNTWQVWIFMFYTGLFCQTRTDSLLKFWREKTTPESSHNFPQLLVYVMLGNLASSECGALIERPQM